MCASLRTDDQACACLFDRFMHWCQCRRDPGGVWPLCSSPLAALGGLVSVRFPLHNRAVFRGLWSRLLEWNRNLQLRLTRPECLRMIPVSFAAPPSGHGPAAIVSAIDQLTQYEQ